MSLETSPFRHLIPNRDRVSAGEYNRAVDLLGKLARSQGDDTLIDSTGIHTRRRVRAEAGTDVRVFEVQSEATGDAVYNCKEVLVDNASWDDAEGVEKLNLKTGAETIEILNLAECTTSSTENGALSSGNIIVAWQNVDDTGVKRWVGIPAKVIGTTIKIFEVKSKGVGKGIYNCLRQLLDDTEWNTTVVDDKFNDSNDNQVEVLNLYESDGESGTELKVGTRLAAFQLKAETVVVDILVAARDGMGLAGIQPSSFIGFRIGTNFTNAGVTDPSFDGTFTCTDIDDTWVYYEQEGPEVESGGGTATITGINRWVGIPIDEPAGVGGSEIEIFEVQSNATGDGIYKCYKQGLHPNKWDNTDGDDRFGNKDTTDVEVLNLLESHVPATYTRMLIAKDRIEAAKIQDYFKQSIILIERLEGVVTVTVADSSGFLVGRNVEIEDVEEESFNGTFEITGKNSTTFTFNQEGDNDSSSGGTATVEGVGRWVGMPMLRETRRAKIKSVNTNHYNCKLLDVDDNEIGSEIDVYPQNHLGANALDAEVLPLFVVNDKIPVYHGQDCKWYWPGEISDSASCESCF